MRERASGGKPTKTHEQVIEALCRADGFVVAGFLPFWWALYLNSMCGGPHIPPDDIWDNVVSGQDKYSAAAKRRILSIVCPLLGEPLIVDPDGLYGVNDMRCIPDAWRLHEGQLDVVEVVDTSPLSWVKMVKYAMIDDALCMVSDGKTRLNLLEICAKKKTQFNHNLAFIFDCAVDCWNPIPEATSEEWDGMSDAKKRRVYYRQAQFTDDFFRPVALGGIV